MTAAEFIDQNKDILGKRLDINDVKSLTDGCVVFRISTSNGQKPILERAVLNAGYYLVVGTYKADNGEINNIGMLGVTAGGFSKLDFVNVNHIRDQYHDMLFLCKPLKKGDPRSNHRFVVKKR